MEVCPRTGRKLTDADIVGEIRCQVFDIPEPKFEVTEHVYFVYAVPGTSKTVHMPFLPGASAPVQYGPHFGSLLIYLRDYQLIPMARIRQLAHDLYGQSISEDTINRFRTPCYEHLGEFEEQLKKRLLQSPVLHADETGIGIEKKTEWLHVLGNEKFTYLWPAIIERFENHREDILRFLSDNAVPFTNNQGERDLRMAKVQQKISGSFRTWVGARRFARIRILRLDRTETHHFRPRRPLSSGNRQTDVLSVIYDNAWVPT